jgi:hypothetical protein
MGRYEAVVSADAEVSSILQLSALPAFSGDAIVAMKVITASTIR